MDTTIMELKLVALAYLQDSHLATIHLQSPQARSLARSLPPSNWVVYNKIWRKHYYLQRDFDWNGRARTDLEEFFSSYI